MGKGQIIGGGAGGEYTVKLILDTARLSSQIAAMNAQIVQIDAKIAAGVDTPALTAQIADLNAKIAVLDAKILAEADPAKKAILIAERTTLQATIVALRAEAAGGIERLKLQKAALTLQTARHAAALARADITVLAWCVDRTENLSGIVGTIEVPGERGTLMIQPGYNGNAAYNKTRDGQLQPVLSATPEAAFWNLAMLPGWQKWKPTYRFGTLTALAGNYCSVALDPATSSQQALNVNQGSQLAGVPIRYRDLHGAAFTVGDAVVVEFTGQSFSSPVVIGFSVRPLSGVGYIVGLSTKEGAVTRHILNCETGDLSVISEADLTIRYEAVAHNDLVTTSVTSVDSTPYAYSGARLLSKDYDTESTPTRQAYKIDGVTIWERRCSSSEENGSWDVVQSWAEFSYAGWHYSAFAITQHRDAAKTYLPPGYVFTGETYSPFEMFLDYEMTTVFSGSVVFRNVPGELRVPFGTGSWRRTSRRRFDEPALAAALLVDSGTYARSQLETVTLEEFEAENTIFFAPITLGNDTYFTRPAKIPHVDFPQYWTGYYGTPVRQTDEFDPLPPPPAMAGIFSDRGIVFLEGAQNARTLKYGGANRAKADPRTLAVHAGFTAAINDADAVEFAMYRRR